MFAAIVDHVRDWFALRELDAIVVAGLESRNEQANFGPGSANRVAFVPVSPLEVIPPMRIGENPRQLVNVLFSFEVSFAGYDGERPAEDLAHRAKCFDLWEATVQAVQRAYSGAHAWGAARWVDERKHGRHGAELVAALTINVPLFDVESPTAKPAPVPGDPKPANP